MTDSKDIIDYCQVLSEGLKQDAIDHRRITERMVQQGSSLRIVLLLLLEKGSNYYDSSDDPFPRSQLEKLFKVIKETEKLTIDNLIEVQTEFHKLIQGYNLRHILEIKI